MAQRSLGLPLGVPYSIIVVGGAQISGEGLESSSDQPSALCVWNLKRGDVVTVGECPH